MLDQLPTTVAKLIVKRWKSRLNEEERLKVSQASVQWESTYMDWLQEVHVDIPLGPERGANMLRLVVGMPSGKNKKWTYECCVEHRQGIPEATSSKMKTTLQHIVVAEFCDNHCSDSRDIPFSCCRFQHQWRQRFHAATLEIFCQRSPPHPDFTCFYCLRQETL